MRHYILLSIQAHGLRVMGIENLINNPEMFDKKYESTVLWAKENRYTINSFLEKVYGTLDVILDKLHNTYELMENGSVLIRKGSVKLNPGEITIILSSMNGDMVMVKATDKISNCLNIIYCINQSPNN